jgi:hypothetical protein
MELLGMFQGAMIVALAYGLLALIATLILVLLDKR